MAVAVSQSLLLIGGPRAMAVALGRVVVQSYWRGLLLMAQKLELRAAVVGQRCFSIDCWPAVGCWWAIVDDCWPLLERVVGRLLALCWEKLADSRAATVDDSWSLLGKADRLLGG